jgi:predicted AAA+ superfamily ATPase
MILKETISEVINHHSDLLKNKSTDTTRECMSSLKIYDSFVLVISGVRRCGKSTLVRQLLRSRQESSIMLNFEDPRISGFELGDFNKLDTIAVENSWEIMAFDEIQHVKGWEKYIRSKVDNRQKIIVTGSNASLLSREFGTSLTGRHITKELFPFSYSEFLIFNGLKPDAQSLMNYSDQGGFPEYLKVQEDEILYRLMDDILYRDITVRYGIRQHQMLRRLAVYLISNIGKLYSLNNLRKVFGFASVRSVADYVSWLEDSYLIFSLPKFSYSIKKTIVNPRKVYCIDNGLAGVNSLSVSRDVGRKLENLVYLHLRRSHVELYYYSEKSECDFIIVEKGKPIKAIQVCYHLDQDNLDRELRGLEEAITDLNIKEGEIITFDQEDSFITGTIEVRAIPAWKYFAGK